MSLNVGTKAQLPPRLHEFAHTDRSIGLSVRKQTPGREYSLVLSFLESLEGFVSLGNNHLAVFQEPRIGNSFPDLVLCVFDPTVFANWSVARQALTLQDLKVLHFLHLAGARTPLSGSTMLGVRESTITECFYRLYDAQLIDRCGDRWEALPLDDAFAISRLIAIEAKINNPTGALTQAIKNRWFASESSVLMPRASIPDLGLARFTSDGIGVIGYDSGGIEELVAPDVHSLPAAYTSWQFNEWIGRALAADT